MGRVRAADGALAGLLAVISVAEVSLTDVRADHPVMTVVLGMTVAATMLVRSMSPLLCLGVATGLVFLSETPALGLTLTGTLVVGLLIALAGVGRRCSDRTSIVAVVSSTALFVVGAAFHGRPWDVVIALIACGSAWQAGRLLRREAARSARLQALAADLTAEQEARERQAVAAERLRIAREVHDTVAHTVSMMTLQVGGVRRRLDPDPAREAERDVLLAVEGLGRAAVSELHRVLGVLRLGDSLPGGGQDAGTPPAPQPSLADIPQLVARFRASGVPVTLRVEGAAPPLSAGVELAGYRVVQEALTNVLKHAAGAHARVTLTYTEETLEVVVEDEGPGEEAGHPGGTGLGILGLRERLALYGGALEAGPAPGCGFRMCATLPVRTEVAT